MSLSLPTIKVIREAADDEEACQALLLQALSYGTDYSVQTKKDDLPQRTEEATNVLVEALSAEQSIKTRLVHALWLVGSQCEDEALVQIIKALVEQAPEDFVVALQATLPRSLVGAAQLAGSKELVRKLKKLNTERHYRQQKFNLMQEESEGYAKLLSVVTTSPLPEDATAQIRDLVGTFELDPNRVLDLLLDVLELHMPSGNERPTKTKEVDKILELLREFSVEKIPHLLGFKVSQASESVPRSLYAMIAFLAKEGLLDLREMISHLLALSEIDKAYELFEKCERQRIQAMGRISLSADGGKKEDPKMAADLAKLKQVTAAIDKSALIGLVKVLLQWKEWELTKLLLPGAVAKVCTLLPNSIGKVLSDHVHERILFVYHANVATPLCEGEITSSDSALPGSASLDEVLGAILEPLDGIMQSGCIVSNPILYCQLCRLMKALFEKEKITDNLSGSAYLLLKMLVSSLSLFPPNPAISADLWSVLSILPYRTRYSLYKEWRGGGLEREGLSSKPLVQVQSEMEAGKAARYSLKRLSKDNIRDMGRQVSKVTHSNPLVVFSTILSQVESYDNLIDMMVEAVRYVTPLGLDVLGYCILSRLDGTSSGTRDRMKDDGMNVSQWLSSLESFTGAFYKKCPQVEFRGLLWYLVGRLKDGLVYELGILRTLLKTAGGYGFADYSPAASLADAQLKGRAGSQMLKRETFAFGVVEQSNLRASRILRSVLQEEDMGVMILILLAQIRTKVIFHKVGRRPKPVKLIGNLYDTCQVVMSMLLEFLTDSTDESLVESGKQVSSSCAMKFFAESLPSLGEVSEKYGLDAESAWMLCRPISRAAVIDEETSDNESSSAVVQSYLPTGETMIEIYRGMLPDEAWENLTVNLFEFFYSHSLYDLCCPSDSYEAEIARLKKEEERLTQRQKGNPSSLMPVQPFTKADEMELNRVRRASTILASDMPLQKKRNESVLQTFETRKTDFFLFGAVSTQSVQAFLTHCVYPRCMSSPDDAMYCARFVELLHQNNTPGFSMLTYIDELLGVVAGALYGVTEGEAANLAILLLETWKMVSRWRYDKDAFAEELTEKLGSSFVLDGEDVSVSEEQFELMYNKWHAKLGSILLGSLNSSEYMVARACLLVLTRLVEVFPTRPGLGQRLMDALEPLQEESYPLQDIKTAAQAYGTLLLKARDQGVWKEEDAAVAEAREEQEKAAQAVRQKKAEEQFEEMKLESEKITKERGPSGTRNWGRYPMRGTDSRHRDSRRSPLNPSALAFEPARGSAGRPPSRDPGLVENGGTSRHRRDDGRGRERDDTGDRNADLNRRSTRVRESSPRIHGRDRDESGRGRATPQDGRRAESSRTSGSRDSSRRGGRDAEPVGLDGRWERGAKQDSRTTGKRGRSPDGDERAAKRGRTDRDGDGSRPSSRDGRRPLSPSRRAPQRESQRAPAPTRRSERRR